ncbi:MAG: DUF4142 domain-containing protein [Pseudomonadota bacterium]
MGSQNAALTGVEVAALISCPANGGRESDQMSPQAFVTHAIQDGVWNMELGKVALQKSSHPEVLKFARWVLEDGSRAYRDLCALAEQSGLSVPGVGNSGNDVGLVGMHKLSGPEFDSAYMRRMAEAQSAAIALFTYASWISNRALAEFARQKLPTIRQRKGIASRVSARLN